MRKVYLDCTAGEAISVYIRDTEVIPAGTTIYSISSRCRNAEYDRWGQEYGISFIFDDMQVEVPFFAVPWVDIFAVDNQGGYLGTVGEMTDMEGDAPVCYFKEGKCYLIAESGPDFMEKAADWRSCLTDYPEVAMYDSMEQAARALEFVSVSSATEAANCIDKH